MKREATSSNWNALAWPLLAVSLGLFALPGCEDKLTPEQCEVLRLESFNVVNNQDHEAPHTCANDDDCSATTWPECPKPVNATNQKKIDANKAKFDEGKCEEPKKDCRKAPRVYCKQGLCVFDEKAGQTNPG